MKILQKILLLSLVIFSRCNSELEDPENASTDEVLQVQVDKPGIRFAQQDTATITAIVPKDAGLLDVKFTSTHGTFIATAAKTINELTDSIAGDFRYASVKFTSDSTQTDVYITLETTNSRKRFIIKVTP